MAGIVAIVGRPNVGKSTFFNRLIKQREAIVDSVAGVTRDRIYGKSDWNGKYFSVIDTGGYVMGSEDEFEGEIRKQVILAIEEATVILFLVDGMEGLNDMDTEVAHLLRKSKKPYFLVVNKVDSHNQLALTAEFYSLGLGEMFPISAINGSGTGELLDEIVKHLPDEDFVENPEDSLPRFTVVGRPNAGKSSFINALIGEERNIVTDIAGTTRDTVNTRYNLFGLDFMLVDTAGVRKKSKVHEDLEFYSVMRAIRAIENSDVCILMVDATRGFEAQDLNIFSLIEKNSKGVVILINKWDLIEKDTKTADEYKKRIQERIAPFSDVPIIFTSVTEKQRIFKAIEEAMEVHKRRNQKFATRLLNDTLLPILEDNPPPATKGKYIKIKFVTQLPTHAPKFAFFANLPQYVKDPYRRFLENQIRKHFDFTGVPIEVFIRKK